MRKNENVILNLKSHEFVIWTYFEHYEGCIL